MHINPDHFLETAAGRVWTKEFNQRAWELSFEALDGVLATDPPPQRLYVLVGPQGSGKSTWAKEQMRGEDHAACFDAILVKRSERAPILAKAARAGVPVVAVWFRTPLELCLGRNAARPADEVCDEQGLRNVFAAVEPPSVAEGFQEVLEITPGDASAAAE